MSRKMFLTISILITVLAAYILFFSGLMPKKTRVVFVIDDEKVLMDLCDDFNRKNSDIKLDVVVKRHYEAEDYIASGRGDIWMPSDASELIYAANYLSDRGYQMYGRFTKIAFTPMIFVSSRERYAYTSEMSLKELYNNIVEKTPWHDINGKTGWGEFKFECPRPDLYETGSNCVALFMHHYFMSNNDPKEKFGIREFSNEVANEYINPLLSNMIMKSHYGNSFLFDSFENPDRPRVDMCVTFEHIFLSTAEYDARYWARVRVHYPDELTISKPVHLVAMSKSLGNAKKAEAIKRFEDYMLSDEVQLKLLDLGYRPAKTTEATEAALAELESKYLDYGFRVELPELRESVDYAFLQQLQDTIKEYIPREY